MLNRSAYRTAHGLIYRRLSRQKVQAEGGTAALWERFIARPNDKSIKCH